MPQAIEPKPDDWWGYPSIETGYDVEALQNL
jgi:hypothetical protein